MSRTLFAVALLAAATAFAQTISAPAFRAADVHVSAPNAQRMIIGVFPESDRYELRGATMVDLISNAWGVAGNKIVGGPGWLALDHFDVVASFPVGSTPEAIKSMVKALLADRFKLVVHDDTRPLTGFTMTVAKGGAKLKKADDAGESGCREPETNAAAAKEGPSYVTFICHKMTMEDFAKWLPGQAGGYLGGITMLDQTNLKGAWDFTLKWSQRNQLTGEGAITLFDATEKQLGLKIESAKIPQPVLVVDSVNEKPADNDPAAVKALAGPTEFELAVIKPSAPDSPSQNNSPFQPGGRFEAHRITLKDMIGFAGEIQDESKIIGAPAFVGKTEWDIVAKAAANGATTNLSLSSVEVMLQNLLKDRFKLAVHNEERPGDVFAFVAAKPKLTKADPANRSQCTNSATNTSPARNRLVVCTNTTMAQLATQLPGLAGAYFQGKPAVDATGLEGAYDFSLNFSGIAIYQRATSAGGDAGGASDPTGAISVQEAMRQQLGIKVESQKRPTTVLVIDHVEETPTDN